MEFLRDVLLEFHQKALNISLKVLGPDHPKVSTSYLNLGAIYLNVGNYEKGMEFHKKALDIRLKAKGHDHPPGA